jgi:hypothetical protein
MLRTFDRFERLRVSTLKTRVKVPQDAQIVPRFSKTASIGPVPVTAPLPAENPVWNVSRDIRILPMLVAELSENFSVEKPNGSSTGTMRTMPVSRTTQPRLHH